MAADVGKQEAKELQALAAEEMKKRQLAWLGKVNMKKKPWRPREWHRKTGYESGLCLDNALLGQPGCGLFHFEITKEFQIF